MLLLNRRVGQRLRIGEDIVVEILDIQGSRVRIGIIAPRTVAIRMRSPDIGAGMPQLEQPDKPDDTLESQA
jgi:hypothetical protein